MEHCLAVCPDSASPSCPAQKPACPILSSESRWSPPSAGWTLGGGGFWLVFQAGASFPMLGLPASLGWSPSLRPSSGSLRRWGQHRAPAAAAPSVHHAPGGAGRGRRSRRHQLCLRSPPQLLQLLGQLHEPGGVLQPHEPRQQRPVSPGRWPHQTGAREMAGSWVPWGELQWEVEMLLPPSRGNVPGSFALGSCSSSRRSG